MDMVDFHRSSHNYGEKRPSNFWSRDLVKNVLTMVTSAVYKVGAPLTLKTVQLVCSVGLFSWFVQILVVLPPVV